MSGEGQRLVREIGFSGPSALALGPTVREARDSGDARVCVCACVRWMVIG